MPGGVLSLYMMRGLPDPSRKKTVPFPEKKNTVDGSFRRLVCFSRTRRKCGRKTSPETGRKIVVRSVVGSAGFHLLRKTKSPAVSLFERHAAQRGSGAHVAVAGERDDFPCPSFGWGRSAFLSPASAVRCTAVGPIQGIQWTMPVTGFRFRHSANRA